MKKILSLICLLFVSVLLVSGCSKDEGVVGTWNYLNDGKTRNDIAYVFNKDNTGSYNFSNMENKFTYEVNGNTITLNYENGGGTNTFEFSIENNILTIKDSFGVDVTYKKK